MINSIAHHWYQKLNKAAKEPFFFKCSKLTYSFVIITSKDHIELRMIRSDNKVMFGAKVPFQDVFTPAVVNNNNETMILFQNERKITK